MPTSSLFATSLNFVKYRIVVTETNVNYPLNQSTVNVQVQATRTTQGAAVQGAGVCTANINGARYTQNIGATDSITYGSYLTVFDKDVTIPHEHDGTKVIYVAAMITTSVLDSNYQGLNVTLTKITRQATLDSVTPQVINELLFPTITYTNRSGQTIEGLQVCLSLDGVIPFLPYKDLPKIQSGTFTYELTPEDIDKFNRQTPNSPNLTGYVVVKSIVDGVVHLSTKQISYEVLNAAPTVSGVFYKDTKASTVAITGNDQYIIQNNSTLQFKINTIKANKYATLREVRATVNGVTKTFPLSGTQVYNKSLNFGKTETSKNTTATIEVEDSRGIITREYINITVLAWKLPTGIVSVKRKSNYYDETYLYVNGEFSSLRNNNVLTIRYQYREQGSNTWSALTAIQDEVTTVLELDNTKAFDFKVIVSDRIGSTTYNVVLPIGIPIIFFDRKRRSVGVGTIPDEDNMLAVDRRLTLNNLLHERVLDLWTFTATAHRFANMYIYNEIGKLLANFGATDNGGYIGLRDHDEILKSALYVNNNGGQFLLYDNNNNSSAQITTDSSGGRLILEKNNQMCIDEYISNDGGAIFLYSSNGGDAVDLYTGTSKDGVLNLYNSSGSIKINCSGQSGKITCVSLTQTSSRKVKENIKELSIEEAYKILELVAVTFDFIEKEQGVDKRGFIAEDVAEIIPELVTPETEKTTAGLDYIEMIPYLQTVIKDQDEKIRKLEKRLEQLEQKFDNMQP